MERVGRQTPTFTNVENLEQLKTSKGDEAIELYSKTGQTLMDWQKYQVAALLDEDGDVWKYMKYGLAVSRRNGKGEILAAREFEGIVNLNEKICHTAHRTTTSHDAFNRLYALLKKAGYEEHSRKKKDMPERSFFASKQYGLEHIELNGGGVIDFRTRTNNGGLGEGFDLLVIDEAQEYTSKQESALAYTVSASPNPQIILTGTPPTAVSGGDVFVKLRGTIMDGTALDTGWAEWSIEQLTHDLTNTDLWYEFNPSLGMLLKERNVRAELSTGEIDFNIQRLGLWLEYSQQSAISRAEWDALKSDPLPGLQDKYYIGVKYGRDGTNVAVSVAVKTNDERIFVETIDCRPVRFGNGWIVEYLHNPKVAEVVVDGANGQQLLAQAMKDNGYKAPIMPKVSEIINANTLWEQAIAGKTVTHAGQPSLADSVSNCEKRAIGSNGGFGFRSISDLYDIAIMDSALLAHWAAATAKENVPVQSFDY